MPSISALGFENFNRIEICCFFLSALRTLDCSIFELPLNSQILCQVGVISEPQVPFEFGCERTVKHHYT